jgi:hypothetical protein
MDLTKVLRFTEDEEKLKELILYIADKCNRDPDFGKTKLNKILFFSDMLYYGKNGKPITGVTYFALEQGPAPQKMLPILKKLIHHDEICIVKEDRFSREQQRVIPLRKANLDCFNAEEIAFVDSIIEALEGKNAHEVSEISHEYAGWKFAAYKETIPYETIFVSTEPPTPIDIARGLELAREYGW